MKSMTRSEREALDQWLRHNETGHADAELARSIEKAGDLAFDYFVDRLRSRELPERHRINAIRGLSHLLRHACRGRTGEALGLIISCFDDPSIDVRSRAISVSLGIMIMIDTAPAWSPEPWSTDPASARAKLIPVIRHAVSQGLNDNSASMASEFLEHSERLVADL
jgi:hypothetical protein